MDPAAGRAATDAIGSADAMLITAGAGMGVDSGLPDFRGPGGFWRAYPPYARLGLRFEQLASPSHFRRDPALAWGFYGHRTNIYREATPHEGFAILRRWVRRMSGGCFVFTSNVDDHFARAGFDPGRILECHGSVEWRQCSVDCGVGIFPADPAPVAVDPDDYRAIDPLPACPGCGILARPNILMFGDPHWDPTRAERQGERFEKWMEAVADARVVVVEMGAGTAVATVRRLSETMVDLLGATLIRINPRDPGVPAGQVSLATGALAGLRAIDDLLACKR